CEGPSLPPVGVTCASQTSSAIRYLVIIIQENHTFDSYFGTYCTAPPGSNPSCTSGPTCCESAPGIDPGSGTPPAVLDDDANGSYDPHHDQACELVEIDGGRMDQFVTAPGCGDARNFAYVDPALTAPYRQLAQSNALADRFFQPVAGSS